MQHAYLIMAHNRPEELRNLMRALDNEHNDLYIHLDRRSSLQPSMFQDIAQKSTVRFVPRHTVTWGGSSQVDTEMELFAGAHAVGGYRYYHIMSGVDFPLKSQQYTLNYFEQYDGMNFFGPKKISEDSDEFTMRYQQYHVLQDSLVGRNRNIWKFIDWRLVRLQKALGIRRFGNRPMKAHQNWVSVTNEVVDRIVARRSEIERKYRWTYCADEVFLLSEIWDTPLRDTLSPYGNLYYVQWGWISEHERAPLALTMRDYDAVQDPNLLFGRKFILPDSAQLIKNLEHDWQSNHVA